MTRQNACFVSLPAHIPTVGAGTVLKCKGRPRTRNVLTHHSIRCQVSTGGDGDTQPLPAGDGTGPAGSGKDMAFVGADMLGISFTCDASGCGERITKNVRRRSYEKGTVLIQCPRCQKHHIIADNYGMYSQITGGKKNVEELAKDRGRSFTRVDAESFKSALEETKESGGNKPATDG